MNRYHTPARLLRMLSPCLAICLALTFFPAMTFAQHDDHAGHDDHDHAAHAEPTPAAAHDEDDDHSEHDDDDDDQHAEEHEEHSDHGDEHDDHEEHAGHDDHEGHDDHHDEPVQFDAATLKEFGIVIRQAGPGVIGETIRLSGEVVFNADRVAHVTPIVSGVVRDVKPSVGDRVTAGDVMAVLSSRELAAARSEYLASQARLELAQESLTRDENLLNQKIGTERQVLEAKQRVREAGIALSLAEQNLHALGQSEDEVHVLNADHDEHMSTYELRAPLTGMVIAREITRGEVVSNTPDEPPFIVADLSSVWVNLTVYQRNLSSVRAGMAVRIEAGHGLAPATGTIAFVSPSLDEITRTAAARVVIDNLDGHWRPGLFVTGYVSSGRTSAAVVLPRSAIQDLDGKPGVFVHDEDGFEPRVVVLGAAGKDTVEIVKGLKPGERYVAVNGFAVKAEIAKASFGDGHNH